MRKPTSRHLVALTALPLLACAVEAPAPAPVEAASAPGPVAASIDPPKAATAEAARAATPIVRVSGARSGSAIAIGAIAGERRLFVADEDGSAIRVIDPARRTETGSIHIDGAPGQLVIDREGFLHAALRYRNEIVVLEATGDAGAPLVERARIPTAPEPVGLAITQDDATLLVTSGWGHELAAISLADRTRRFAVDLPREPRAVLASEDGSTALVSHVAGGTISAVSLTGDDHAVSAIPLAGADVAGFSPCGEGGLASSDKRRRTGVQGFSLARVGDRVLAPMTMARTGPGGAGYSREGTFPAEELGVVSLGADASKPTLRMRDFVGPVSSGRTLVNASARPDPSPCILPRAATGLAARSSILVACVGTDEVIEIEARDARLGETERGRWRVASGPTGLAADEAAGEVFVLSRFAREVSMIPLGASVKGARGVASYGIPFKSPAPLGEKIALGQRLFHAVSYRAMSADGRVCASCHPDGRDDGLVWSVAGAPLQTPMLAGRLADTAPYGWKGDSKTVKDHVGKTFGRLGGIGLGPTELDALISYVASIPTPAIPSRAADPRVARGHEVFASEQTMCTICHTEAGAFTDGMLHDVGAGPVETPSLRFVAGTAPYFHDGRHATLHDLLLATDGKMGQVKHLSQDDLSALEVYLASL